MAECVCGGWGAGEMGKECARQRKQRACPESGGGSRSWWTHEVWIHRVSWPGLGS